MERQPKLNVVVDTREQAPWPFDPNDVTVTQAALRAGDYSVAGLEGRVALERKSLGDYVNTVIHDWLRFRKELTRLSGYDVAAVVVEADLRQVYDHEYESDAAPNSVLGRTHGILIDHGVPVLWWGPDRIRCAHAAYRMLALALKKLGP
jgi:ERCC4-type nuclease